MMNLSVLIACLYQVRCIIALATVPVLMLDYDLAMVHVSVPPNPFKKLNSSSFRFIIRESIEHSAAIIIFIERTFCIEDLSSKDRVYGSPFQNLRSHLLEDQNKVKYFPSVIEPYNELLKVFPPKEDAVFYYDNKDKLLHLKTNFQYMYLFFDDFYNETYTDKLRRHDNLIESIVKTVSQRKLGPVVAFYTGKINPIVVESLTHRMNYVSNTKSQEISINSPRVLLQISGAIFGKKKSRRYFRNNMKPLITNETSTKSKFYVSIKFEIEDMEMEWTFDKYATYWQLVMIAFFEGPVRVAEGNLTKLSMKAPYNYSYYCKEYIIMPSEDGTLYIIDEIQVEPLDILSTQIHFSPAVNCSVYITYHILMGLIVSVVLLAVLTFGIMMLYDCSPNHRYDKAQDKIIYHNLMVEYEKEYFYDNVVSY